MAKDKTVKSRSARKRLSLEQLHKPERVLALSDGVVAVAITVLVLPLADIDLPQQVIDSGTVASYIWNTYSQLMISFVITWLVIIAYWFDHYKLFNRLNYVDNFTIRVNMLWLFAIVVLPFPTNLLGQSDAGPSGEIVCLYLLVLFITNLAMFLMEYHIEKYPELRDPERAWYTNSWVFGLAAAIYILILACLAPFLGGGTLWGLFGLFFLGSFARLGNLGSKAEAPDPKLEAEAKEADNTD